jgi:hypothetical protein
VVLQHQNATSAAAVPSAMLALCSSMLHTQLLGGSPTAYQRVVAALQLSTFSVSSNVLQVPSYGLLSQLAACSLVCFSAIVALPAFMTSEVSGLTCMFCLTGCRHDTRSWLHCCDGDLATVHSQ